MTENPFASPLADSYGASPSGPERTDAQYREGSVLVHEIGADFPSRCVKCNVPVGSERLKRNLSWHSPGLYILIVFPGVLIYAIVAMIVRKTAVVHVGVCDRHRTKRRNAILIGWAGFFAGFAALVRHHRRS